MGLHQLEQQVLDGLPDNKLTRIAKVRIEDVRFLAVGSLGFLINLIALWLLHGRLGLALFPAQLVSAELALLSNFGLHHSWTYQNYKTTSLTLRLTKFHATAWTGVLMSSIVVWASATYLHIYYLFAVVIGSILSFGWNYLLNKYVIWAKRPRSFDKSASI